MNQSLIKQNERLDDLQNGFYIIQDPARFCFGMDAVLLSAFACVRPGENVLDLGTGNGIIPILLCAKTKGDAFTGLEIQKELVDMAARSAAYNHLTGRIRFVHGNIKEAAALFGAASFRVVTSNPPYMKSGHGRENGEDSVSIARHEILCGLEDVIREGAAVLKEKGRFYMVHRPFRLAEIIRLMCRYRLEPKRLRLVYPYRDREPNMVLIEGVKGASPWLKTEPPLIVYKKPGEYTEEVLQMYRAADRQILTEGSGI